MVKKIALASILCLGVSATAFADNNEAAVGRQTVTPTATGPACTPGTTLWAVVNADGTLARGTPGTTTSKVGTGAYEVVFTLDVHNAAFVAVLGLTGSSGTQPAGMVTTVGRAGNPNGVWLSTYNVSGTNTNQPFHLIVQC